MKFVVNLRLSNLILPVIITLLIAYLTILVPLPDDEPRRALAGFGHLLCGIGLTLIMWLAYLYLSGHQVDE